MLSFLQDHLSSEVSVLKTTTALNYNYIQHITTTLQEVGHCLQQTSVYSKLSVDLLKHMAMARFSLVCTVSLLNLRYLSQSKIDDKVEKELQRLFAVLTKLVLAVKNSSVHMFILRQIIHCYGMKDLQVIIEQSDFNWLNLDTTKTDDLVSCFVVN